MRGKERADGGADKLGLSGLGLSGRTASSRRKAAIWDGARPSVWLQEGRRGIGASKVQSAGAPPPPNGVRRLQGQRPEITRETSCLLGVSSEQRFEDFCDCILFRIFWDLLKLSCLTRLSALLT